VIVILTVALKLIFLFNFNVNWIVMKIVFRQRFHQRPFIQQLLAKGRVDFLKIL